MTVLLESIDLLLLQLRVTRPKPMAQRVVPPYILIKRLISTIDNIRLCFNHVDISASFKKFVKITPTCFRDHKIGCAAPIYKMIRKGTPSNIDKWLIKISEQ